MIAYCPICLSQLTDNINYKYCNADFNEESKHNFYLYDRDNIFDIFFAISINNKRFSFFINEDSVYCENKLVMDIPKDFELCQSLGVINKIISLKLFF